MALKDSFINLNKALRTTLQNVPAVVDTLIRGFDEIGDAAEEQTTYSTTEHIVGKWIDGSDIYETTVQFGALPNTATKAYNHGITNIGTVISINAIGNTNEPRIPIPFVFNDETYINIYVNSTSFIVTTDRDASSYIGVATIRYTKSAANRTLKNDTKNVVDVEDDITLNPAPAEDLKK